MGSADGLSQDRGKRNGALVPALVTVLVLLVMAVPAVWCYCRMKRARTTLQKMPMVVGATSGAYTSQVEMNSPYTPPASGTKNMAARMRARAQTGSTSRCLSAESATAVPVVVHVPLPDLDRPIVAHLDANHQIVGTRDESELAQAGEKI